MKTVKCRVCHNEFERGDDEHWKTLCYDCYMIWPNGHKLLKRIEPVRGKFNLYLCHPSVTKEELDNWIADNKQTRGWGVKEYNPRLNFKIWIDDTNFD